MIAIQLAAKNLGHGFARGFLFRHLNFSLEKGRILGIMGANGSGKTTLLRIVAGLLRPREGSVQFIIDDRPLSVGEYRHNLGFITPHMALYPQLSALENMEFMGRLRGVNLSAKTKAEILSKVGLPHCGNEKVGFFSAGMAQRLKIGCVLVYSPLILLLDEPTVNLDADGRQLVEQLIKTHEGITILATNEIEEVAWSHDHIYLGSNAADSPQGFAQ